PAFMATPPTDPLEKPRSLREVYLEIVSHLPEVEAKPTGTSEKHGNELNDEVRLAGAMLGQILYEHEGSDFYRFIEAMRKATKTARKSSGRIGQEALDRLIQAELEKRPDDEAILWLQNTTKAFRLFLTLTGIIEGYHQSRTLNREQIGL